VKDWKACERKVAALLGGMRVPVSGRGRGHSPDILHERLSIEVKSRRKLPAWLMEAMKQAEDCAQDGQLPLIVLHQDGQRYQDALMVMRLKDFLTITTPRERRGA
jgi:hypothetical protein